MFRLPIVQGGTFAFIVPTIAILNSNKYQPCNEINTANMTYEEVQEEVWGPRLREVQGNIIIASIFQVFIGFSGK